MKRKQQRNQLAMKNAAPAGSYNMRVVVDKKGNARLGWVMKAYTAKIRVRDVKAGVTEAIEWKDASKRAVDHFRWLVQWDRR